MIDFEIEELLPIVSDLAQRYGSYANTSVTYETAQQLMGAVVYCIEECEKAALECGGFADPGDAGLIGDQRKSLIHPANSAREQYRLGIRLVVEKTKAIRKLYNQMIPLFEHYGVRCLADTVQKGIPEFLKWYDVDYHPQDTIIIPDYPVLADDRSLRGADRIFRYLRCIWIEQKFLNSFDKNYVVSVLKQYDPHYEFLFENICEIVLADLLGRTGSFGRRSKADLLQAAEKAAAQICPGDAEMCAYLRIAAEMVAERR